MTSIRSITLNFRGQHHYKQHLLLCAICLFSRKVKKMSRWLRVTQYFRFSNAKRRRVQSFRFMYQYQGYHRYGVTSFCLPSSSSSSNLPWSWDCLQTGALNDQRNSALQPRPSLFCVETLKTMSYTKSSECNEGRIISFAHWMIFTVCINIRNAAM